MIKLGKNWQHGLGPCQEAVGIKGSPMVWIEEKCYGKPPTTSPTFAPYPIVE